MPLYRLSRKDEPFEWTDDCETSFQKLKQMLISAPILQFPDFTQPFILYTDASSYSLGAVLAQIHGGKNV